MTNTGRATPLLLGARHSKDTNAIILALILLIPPPLRPLCIQIIPASSSAAKYPECHKSSPSGGILHSKQNKLSGLGFSSVCRCTS